MSLMSVDACACAVHKHFAKPVFVMDFTNRFIYHAGLVVWPTGAN